MDKDTRDFLLAADARAAAAVTGTERQRWEWLLKGSGWTPGTSDVPGYFPGKRRGQKCLWSCNWVTSIGIIRPADYRFLDHLTVAELVCEGSDITRRSKPVYSELVMMLLDYYQDSIDDPEYWLSQLRLRLQDARGGYQDYVCPWSEPDRDKIIVRNLRAGWEAV